MKSGMKKLKEAELIDLLDTKADSCDLLDCNAADMADMKLAMQALQAWNEAEPVQVSENFWPRIREQLPARPPRSPLRRAASTLGAWLWPSHSPLAASMRVAALAAIVALAGFWFAPQNATQPAVALSPEATAFIERSLQKHDNYVATQPADGGLAIPAGDVASSENDSDEPSAEYVP
jgi:hypothetical protein